MQTMMAPKYFKQVAGWEARAAEKVQRLAPSYTSLLSDDEGLAVTTKLLGRHMDARFAELRDILRKL